MLFFYEMIPQAEGNQCMPSIYKPSSAYYADITTVTHWKHSRSCTWARLLSDAFILKIRTGCKCFFSSLHGPPVLFSLLLCQAGFGKGSPHRPIDWLTVSNRSRSRFFPGRDTTTVDKNRRPCAGVPGAPMTAMSPPAQKAPASGWLSPCDAVRGNGVFKRHRHCRPLCQSLFSLQ